MEVERDEDGRPKMYADIKSLQKTRNKDPFEDMHFVGVYGLGLANYAYNFVDKDQKEQVDKKRIKK